MMAKKKCKLTDKERRVAIWILEEYIYGHEGFDKNFFDRIMDAFQLMTDPFTGLPCTPTEWEKNSYEYDCQLMEARYGHHDGL